MKNKNVTYCPVFPLSPDLEPIHLQRYNFLTTVIPTHIVKCN